MFSTIREAFEQHVEKLKKRYPAGYTNEAAQHRADKAPGKAIPAWGL